jgi:hypothetical protein
MKLIMKNVRMAFPSIWEPFEDGGKFNVKAILPKNHPQLPELEAAMLKVAQEKWGAKADAVLKALKAADKTCIHNGDAKTDWEGFEGNFYISASNKVRPSVFDRDKSPLVEADGVIYSGCMFDLNMEIWAQDNEFGKRLNATLRGVRFRADGDRFSGGGSAPAEADEFEDDISAPDDDLAA